MAKVGTIRTIGRKTATRRKSAQKPVTRRQRVRHAVLPPSHHELASTAFYLSLASFPFFLPAPIAFGVGVASLSHQKRTKLKKKGRARAWFAVIYSGIFTALLVAFLIDVALHRSY